MVKSIQLSINDELIHWNDTISNILFQENELTNTYNSINEENNFENDNKLLSVNYSTLITSSLINVPFNETLIWSLLFYPMVIMAAIGNILIIWIIATKPLMKNIMNQYLINLTLSDFLSVTFNASFNFVFMLNQHWPFGKIYCLANNFIANLTIVSSVSTMMLISIDRYVMFN